MACLNMQLNNDQQAGGGGGGGGFCNNVMGPRISFSNDFVDSNTQQSNNLKHHENCYREAPVSSDFEFSVPRFSSNSADEVFFKGKLLPLKEKVQVMTTLRDELLAGDHDDDDDFLPRLPKNSGWWREKFGLRRTHSGTPKKGDKNLGGLETIDEANKPVFANEIFTGSNRYE